MKLCESELASGSHGSNFASSASSGQPVATGGRSGSRGGLKLGIVRLGRAAGKVGWFIYYSLKESTNILFVKRNTYITRHDSLSKRMIYIFGICFGNVYLAFAFVIFFWRKSNVCRRASNYFDNMWEGKCCSDDKAIL